ncbi:MAG: hypothetical protein QOD06_942 [Candidatus Binatota bacterium]|jgi:RNA polymerase subunit RPABC4/transcription elongation factor Spt4|nr:hypothetical protein [Candidatus Binatota bacterium]
MAQIQCPHCGYLVPSRLGRCIVCGEPLRSREWIAMVIVMTVAGGAAGFALAWFARLLLTD